MGIYFLRPLSLLKIIKRNGEFDFYWITHHCDNWWINKPTRCHLIFYCTYYRLNMFLALICPSSGARDYDVVYHIGRVFLGLLCVGSELRLGWSSVRVAHDQRCKQHHSREFLMMGILLLETCWVYKEYNKISSGI